MENWAFFDENGNEITRGWQGMRHQARDQAQRFADERGEAIEFQTEDSLLCPEDVAIEDWDGPPTGEIVHPNEEPEADEDDLPHVAWLKKHGACGEGVAFASRYSTIQEAWDACENLDHLVWVALTAADVRIAGIALPDGLKGLPAEASMDVRDALREAYAEIGEARNQAEADAADLCEVVDCFRFCVLCPELV